MRKTNQLPKFMAEGSKGPIVTVLHAFLAGQGLSSGLIFDTDFAGLTTEKVKKFQKRNDLDDDGCFGTDTRALAKDKFNFDLEAAALTIPGETTFCDTVHGEESVIFENTAVTA